MKIPSIRVLGILLALVVVGLAIAFWPRAPERPEEMVRRQVVAMTAAAQNKDVAAVLDPVSEDFRSADNLDKQGLKSLLTYQLLRGQWVRVFTTDLKLTALSSEEVDVSAKFIFGRSDAQELKDLARESVMATYAIDAKARKEQDGTWRFVWARYRPIDPSTLF